MTRYLRSVTCTKFFVFDYYNEMRLRRFVSFDVTCASFLDQKNRITTKSAVYQ